MFVRFLKDAAEYLSKPGRLTELLRAGWEKAAANTIALSDVWTYFTAMLRLVQAWLQGRCAAVLYKTLLASVVAIDLIDAFPDMIPGVGLVDDAALIAWVITTIKSDLDAFLRWEGEGGLSLSFT